MTDTTKRATAGEGIARNNSTVTLNSWTIHSLNERLDFTFVIKKTSLVLFYIAKDLEPELRL